jgi:DNA repair exonuclease SbcCD ATPase subunit
MKFHNLELENFLTIGKGKVALNDRGLNVIQGKNDDDGSAESNGAGKSSIVDGLSWALFGVTARGVKGDSVVNRTAGKGTRVAVTFATARNRYRVTRYRKHKDHKNQLHIEVSVRPEDEPTRLDKGTEAESQKVLEGILGCSHEVFVAAVYSGQEAMPDLPGLGDRELKRLIEEAAGMQRIESAYATARSRAGLVASELSAQILRSSALQEAVEKCKVDLQEAKASHQKWEDERETRIANATAGVNSGMAASLTASGLVESLEVTVGLATKEEPALQAALNGLKSQAALVVEAEKAATTLERAVDRPGLVAIKRQIDLVTQNVQQASATIGQPCKECGKPHTEADLSSYLAAQRKQLDILKADAVKMSALVREQMEKAAAATTLAKTLRDALPDPASIASRLQKITTLQGQLKAAQDALKNAKVELDRRHALLASEKSATNPLAAIVTRSQAQLAAAETKAVESKLALAALQSKNEVASAVVKVFGPAGVRAQILDTVTPFLNDRTADYLSVLSDGAITAAWSTLSKDSKGDLKEKFAIDVTHAHGAESFAGLSGGEKRKVRLATALALQDLVAQRAVQPIDLWIGDEVDDALDPAGLERLMTLLERKARERGTVLVISHNSLSDWCDQVTTVTKKGGVSVINGALAV